ncbi:snare associated Golgi protein-domain-containing protein [Triangularia setosa]|uniref:Golgi apparatus membrane protein TVP38 n=1 Tax=Triangularia setosa TaxID=2587417 RepID=A0AAN6WEC0_9PEZI|nr:snare associated Golgi protein-domain-containing protein [Podospora setosa]
MGPDDIEMVPPKTPRGSAPAHTDYQPVNWKRLFLRPKYLVMWAIAVIIIILTVIITIYHDNVVEHLRPFAQQVRDLPAGWLIPIVILIAISFPPLFGHEIIALLCGVVYGLWIGFGIVAAGTFLGEIGTWFAFKYLFRQKSEKLERTSLSYGALARITRDGGFWIVLIIRFSAIPTHFSTAVFSTCGVNFWIFAIATFLTLPKQIFLVYLGVLLLEEKPDDAPKNIVFGIAFVLTIVMAGYIGFKMRAVKKILIEEQEERRQTSGLPTMDDAANSGDGVMDTERIEYDVLSQHIFDGGMSGPVRSHTPLDEPSKAPSSAPSGWTTEALNTPDSPGTPTNEYFGQQPVKGYQWV